MEVKNIVAAILAVAFAMFASAADFAVPQGGGKLPTIALVECLADENAQASGQFCRATYDCAGDTGVLWQGLRSHNGRRVTLETDAIANQRDCVLKVEDAARVQFFTGYRPAGRTGEVVAMVRSGQHAASSTIGSTTIPANNMLGQFLSHSAVRTATLQDWINNECDGGGHGSADGCRTGGQYIEGVPATAKTFCYVEASITFRPSNRSQWLASLADDWRRQGENYSSVYRQCNAL